MRERSSDPVPPTATALHGENAGIFGVQSASADEAFVREFEHSRRELNVERVRVISGATLVANVLATSWRTIEWLSVGEDVRRSSALAMVHAASLPVSLALFAATGERGAKRYWLAAVRDHAGEWASVHLCVIGAAVNVLGFPRQTEPFSLALAMVASTALYRARRSVLVPTLLGTATFVVACAIHDLGPTRAVGALWISLFFALVTAKVSKTLWVGFESEVRVRTDHERLNRELDQRVREQTASVMAQSAEVERLNAVLSQRVRETSRALSRALSRLSKGDAVETALAPGTVLADRVEVRRAIGRGGMGIVYEATDLSSSSRVAVKVVAPRRRADLDAMFRLFREAEAIASLGHPSIVKSEHVGVSDEGLLFIVLQFVDGRTVGQALETDGRWAVERAAALGSVLFAALDVAHRAGITHRDIKPENLMLVSESPGLKLLDFGLAQIRESASPLVTSDELIVGTPAYMSPEQVLAPEQVGPAADVYAAALVLYQLVASKAPYEADKANEWVARHAFSEPTPLRTALEGVDAEFDAVVMACLAKKPEERPSASRVAAVMESIVRRAGGAPIEVYERARSERLAQRRTTPASGQRAAVIARK